MRCQRCPKPATLHITEILGPKQVEEMHYCEECAQKHLDDSSTAEKLPDPKLVSPGQTTDDIEEINRIQCPHCGIKFKDFRSTGRLGCPHDYEVFRPQLMPLLENIHGEVQHQGKAPRHKARATPNTGALANLRRQLQGAVGREDYEQAAQLRDKIRELETSS